jgi:hypothetical protein
MTLHAAGGIRRVEDRHDPGVEQILRRRLVRGLRVENNTQANCGHETRRHSLKNSICLHTSLFIPTSAQERKRCNLTPPCLKVMVAGR